MAPYRPTPTVVICLLLHAVAVLGVVLMPAHWAGWLTLLALAQGVIAGRGGIELGQQRLAADPVVRDLLGLGEGATRQNLVPIACHCYLLMLQEEAVYVTRGRGVSPPSRGGDPRHPVGQTRGRISRTERR